MLNVETDSHGSKPPVFAGKISTATAAGDKYEKFVVYTIRKGPTLEVVPTVSSHRSLPLYQQE